MRIQSSPMKLPLRQHLSWRHVECKGAMCDNIVTCCVLQGEARAELQDIGRRETSCSIWFSCFLVFSFLT